MSQEKQYPKRIVDLFDDPGNPEWSKNHFCLESKRFASGSAEACDCGGSNVLLFETGWHVPQSDNCLFGPKIRSKIHYAVVSGSLSTHAFVTSVINHECVRALKATLVAQRKYARTELEMLIDRAIQEKS